MVRTDENDNIVEDTLDPEPRWIGISRSDDTVEYASVVLFETHIIVITNILIIMLLVFMMCKRILNCFLFSVIKYSNQVKTRLQVTGVPFESFKCRNKGYFFYQFYYYHSYII